MVRKTVISLFTSYTISAFLFYYLPIDTILYLFIGLLAVTAHIHFRHDESFLSKALINLSTAIQLSYLIIAILFDKLQLPTPEWMVFRDEIIAVLLFILLSILSSVTAKKEATTVFINSSTAAAMGFASTLFLTGQSNGVYQLLFSYPVFAFSFYFLISGKKNKVIETVTIGALISYGSPFLLSKMINGGFGNGNIAVGELLLIMTWLATNIAPMLFIEEKVVSGNRKKTVPTSSGVLQSQKEQMLQDILSMKYAIENSKSLSNDSLFDVIKSMSLPHPESNIYQITEITGKSRKEAERAQKSRTRFWVVILYALYGFLCYYQKISFDATGESRYAELLFVLLIIGVFYIILVPLFVDSKVKKSQLVRINREIDELNDMNNKEKRELFYKIKALLASRGVDKLTDAEREEKARERFYEKYGSMSNNNNTDSDFNSYSDYSSDVEEESENWMDKLKRDKAEWEEKEQARYQSLNARSMGRDTYDVKQFDDAAGLSRLERENLDRDTDYKRESDDIFWSSEYEKY